MRRSGQFSLKLPGAATLIPLKTREGFSMHTSLATRASDTVPLDAVRSSEVKAWLSRQDARDANWLRRTNFTAKAGELRLVPSRKGEIGFAVLGLGDERDPLALAA